MFGDDIFVLGIVCEVFELPLKNCCSFWFYGFLTDKLTDDKGEMDKGFMHWGLHSWLRKSVLASLMVTVSHSILSVSVEKTLS